MNKTARIIVLKGEGKGKTTSAIGIAIRAIANGMRVLFLQFIKNDDTVGEFRFFNNLEGIDIYQFGAGFLPKYGTNEFKIHMDKAIEGMNYFCNAIHDNLYKVYILDEILVAMDKHLIDANEVRKIILGAASDNIIVLTGRTQTGFLEDIADTVSEIRCVKHGISVGIVAQAGVEF